MDPDILKKDLANKIRSLRLQNNLTLKELSFKSDISEKYMGEIERAEKNPSLLIIVSIVNALRIDLIELLDFNSQISTNIDERKAKLIKYILNKMRNKDINDIDKAFNILKITFDNNVPSKI